MGDHYKQRVGLQGRIMHILAAAREKDREILLHKLQSKFAIEHGLGPVSFRNLINPLIATGLIHIWELNEKDRHDLKLKDNEGKIVEITQKGYHMHNGGRNNGQVNS